MLTQEIEIGLPHRFGIAFENSIENHRGTTQERTFSIEGRYALADWNKIPLNPTIFVEYKFGVGDILHDEGPPEMVPKGEGRAFLEEHLTLPDAVEVRLAPRPGFQQQGRVGRQFFCRTGEQAATAAAKSDFRKV